MADFSEQIVTLLTTDWNSANTDSVTPKIEQIYDRKAAKMTRVAANDGDFVWVLDDDTVQSQSGINTTHKDVTELAKIMIRSAVDRAHGIKIRDEVVRIIDANHKNPFTDYFEIEPIRVKDLSDGLKKTFKWIMDIEAKRFHVSRT